MELLLLVVGGTSVGGVLLGRRGGAERAPEATLTGALAGMLECVGTAVVFLGVNLAVGALAVLAGRALTREFVSLYLVTDDLLLVLSLLQGLTYRLWRRGWR